MRLPFAAVSAVLVATACGPELTDDEQARELSAADEELGELDSALTATYDAHRLLEDLELEGDQAVSVDQVQMFLDWKGSFLAGYVDPVYGLKAARLIVERARAHKISPVYLLARIQTESGLIESGTNAKLSAAAGCGCPDSGGCKVSYVGFGKQMECAAAKMRNYLTRLETHGATISGWRVNRAKSTSDPCSVTPKTRATAVLYTYTPWVGAYATQCGRKTVGGSSLLAGKLHLYEAQWDWSPL